METDEGRVPSLFISLPVQIIVGFLLLVALLSGQKALALLTLIVLGLTVGTRLWSRMSPTGVKCRAEVDKIRLFPGETLYLEAEVVNAKFWPVWIQVGVNRGNSFKLLSENETFSRESGLLWYERVRFRWGLVAQRRGIHPVGPSGFKVGDPLGFFPRAKEAEAGPPVIVYPKLLPLKPLSLARHDFFGVPGTESPVRDPVYILGTRDYQHWRPARFIHWKTSARHSRLQEKVFEPTEQEKVLLLLSVDKFAENSAEHQFEETLEAVASLAVRLDGRGRAVGLVTNGAVVGDGPTTVPVTRNPQHLPALLEVLARVEMTPKEVLLETLLRGTRLLRGVSCVHFSFQEDETTVAAEHYLRQRNIPVVFFVCQPREVSEKDDRNVKGRIHDLKALLLDGDGVP